ncbi:MAG: hypothetical protein JWP50_3448 [Phenylobacterium sp.]|nr:hypothetical protein [Phenylobacterium sp.]
MTRIVYCIYSAGGLQGGHKMILRHVETLRDLGFDAVAYTGEANTLPSWFEHRAPVIRGSAIRAASDIVVAPDDAFSALRELAALKLQPLVFVQNHYNFVRFSLEIMELFPAERAPSFLAIGPSVAATLRRLYPQAAIETIRSFADERVFRPGDAPPRGIALVPRKRPREAEAIRHLFGKLHPRHADLPWRSLETVSETEMAEALRASSLFLSLSLHEGLGMTPLEAMASGCLCAGFTGIGGRDYATPDNGLWVDEDDFEAATEALARAADLAAGGGPELRRRLEAGYETARAWSYAAFRRELEEVWMRLAPQARRGDGPLGPP